MTWRRCGCDVTGNDVQVADGHAVSKDVATTWQRRGDEVAINDVQGHALAMAWRGSGKFNVRIRELLDVGQ